MLCREGRGRVLDRLQEETIKPFDDHSLFAWIAAPFLIPNDIIGGLVAKSLANLDEPGRFSSELPGTNALQFSSTNRASQS